MEYNIAIITDKLSNLFSFKQILEFDIILVFDPEDTIIINVYKDRTGLLKSGMTLDEAIVLINNSKEKFLCSHTKK